MCRGRYSIFRCGGRALLFLPYRLYFALGALPHPARARAIAAILIMFVWFGARRTGGNRRTYACCHASTPAPLRGALAVACHSAPPPAPRGIVVTLSPAARCYVLACALRAFYDATTIAFVYRLSLRRWPTEHGAVGTSASRAPRGMRVTWRGIRGMYSTLW